MHRSLALLLALVLTLALVPASLMATAGTTDYDIPNGHFYTQAVAPGTSPEMGHSITDSGTDDRGQIIMFWTAFRNLGGVAALGYPSSERFLLDGFWTQATQRVLMQWRPELKAVVFVNVFDKLHDVGQDELLLASKQVPVQVNDNGSCSDSDFTCIKKYRLSWLDGNAAIKNFYFSNVDPVTYYGLPTSHIDTSNNAFDIIRLQRIVIQYWKVSVPGVANAGMITVGLGGDISKDQGLVPANVGAPIQGPGVTQPTPPSPPTTAPGDIPNPWGYTFQSTGKLIYDPPSNFCTYFSCIANFWNGSGYVVQCNDDMFSKSGGRSGSCSRHGGNKRPLYAP